MDSNFVALALFVALLLSTNCFQLKAKEKIGVFGMMFRSVIAALLVCLTASIAAAQAPAPRTASSPDIQTPDLQTIVSRMMQAQDQNRTSSRAITVKRDYQLLDKTYEQKARVVANVTYLPPDHKQYEVESSHGGMGEKILRDVLDHETEKKDARETARKEFSPDNYAFSLAGSELLDGRRCFVLQMNPRHEDKDLLRGQVWVDAENFNIRKLEGNPSKSPSWWIRDLHILMSFSEVDGMWLRTFTQAVANVRFKGRFEMVARDLEYHPVEQNVVQNRVLRRRTSVITGAALTP